MRALAFERYVRQLDSAATGEAVLPIPDTDELRRTRASHCFATPSRNDE